MKNTVFSRTILVALTLILGMQSSQAQTNIPHIISYQGVVANIPDGMHSLTVTLYTDANGTRKVWSDTYTTEFLSGVFAIALGGGEISLPEPRYLDKPLWVGVRVNGTEEMRPLTRLMAVPYALNVPDKSITMEKLSDEVNARLTHIPGEQKKQNDPDDWTMTGDNVTNNSKKLGSLDDYNWDVYAHGQRIVRYQKDANAAHPDIIGGWGGKLDSLATYPGNSIIPGRFGSNVISGGGLYSTAHPEGSPNAIYRSNYATIGGGGRNLVGDTNATIESTSETYGQTIGGGGKNKAYGSYTTVSGGRFNRALRSFSTIGGGKFNMIGDNNHSDSSGEWFSAIPGGHQLWLGGNSFGYNGSDLDNLLILKDSSQLGVFNDVDLWIGNVDGKARQLRLLEGNTELDHYDGANFTSLRAGQQDADIHYIFPLAQGQIGSLLYLDNIIGATNGQMKWLGQGANGYILRWVGGKPKWDPDTVGGGGAMTLKWYAESDATPNVPPQASDTGAVSHGEQVVAGGKYSTVGGGHNNQALAHHSVIGGGKSNYDSAAYSGIFSGESNHITPEGEHSVISGGKNNVDSSAFTVIGGGTNNTIFASSNNSSIAGGDSNMVKATYASISGGKKNVNSGKYASVGGGYENAQFPTADYGFIGGGYGNINLGYGSVIGGGTDNFIDNDPWYNAMNVISGGRGNISEHGGHFNVIAGGDSNENGGAISVISGGMRNRIHDNSLFSTIGGGQYNYIGDQFHTYLGPAISWSTIGGGDSNFVHSNRSVIAGGCYNQIFLNSEHASITGGCGNVVADSFGFVGGGSRNLAMGIWSTIAGGGSNKILTLDTTDLYDPNRADYGTIGGGRTNEIIALPSFEIPIDSLATYRMPVNASILGGSSNKARGHFSSILGGAINEAKGFGSSVLGGINNVAYDFQTVTGLYNRKIEVLNNLSDPVGAGDTIHWKFSASNPNLPLFIVGGGFGDAFRRNVFEVTLGGYSTVYQVNSEGVYPNGTTKPTNFGEVRLGSTYVDNVVYAWGDVSPDTTTLHPNKVFVNGSFGVQSITRNSIGDYTIILKTVDPITGDWVTLSDASVTANIVQEFNDSLSGCHFIFPSELVTDIGTGCSKFRIRIRYNNGCILEDRRFTFQVVGRR